MRHITAEPFIFIMRYIFMKSGTIYAAVMGSLPP